MIVNAHETCHGKSGDHLAHRTPIPEGNIKINIVDTQEALLAPDNEMEGQPRQLCYKTNWTQICQTYWYRMEAYLAPARCICGVPIVLPNAEVYT